MILTGAQIIMEVLKEENVDTIFGFPGGTVMDIYDAMMNTSIRHITARHEQGAVHAADGYARAGGRVGVCLVTSGPGATNTVTGIASAYMDSTPLVVITGQVPTHLIGNDAFQEVDIVGITRPCTKHNYLVKEIRHLARILREAFYIARSGRPGPVLIDIPKDVLNQKILFETKEKITLKSYQPVYKPNEKQLRKVIELIRQAEKPVIFAGGGVILSRAAEELTRFAMTTQIPVFTSLMGLGAFPGSHPLSLGMVGMHGTYRANMTTGECDLLIGIGVRFDDRVTGKTETFAPHARVVHIDIDPTSIRKNVSVHIPVVGDCKITLACLNELLKQEQNSDFISGRKKWLDRIDTWRQTMPSTYHQQDVVKPQYVIDKLYELTGGKAVITTEVGQNQMWAAQYYHFDRPGRFITSGGLGCMGFGLPAAIGAQIANPDDLVIDIAGDGSIQMNIQELATAVQFGLPVKVVILNNCCLGMVRQWQELFYDKRYAWTLIDHTPDFVRLAESYGAVGLRATRPQDVVPVLKEGLNRADTVIMDFVIEQEENVYPMVPAGESLTQMLLV